MKKKVLAALIAAICCMGAIPISSMAENSVEEQSAEVQKSLITVNDIIRLSKKGEELTWSDFKNYEYTDIGSGLYVWEFKIENKSSKLKIGGGNLEEKPDYITYLVGNGAAFDIRIQNIEWLLQEDVSFIINDENSVRGDANCDGELSMADAVIIMQSIANPSKFGIEGTAETHITEQGKINGDIAGNNDGITNADALAIQKKLLGLDDVNPGKPLPTQRIALKCQNFCAIDETLKIDVAMGDMYSYQKEHSGYPTYDTPGHAEYGIYACDSVNYSKIENEKLIINGEKGEYKKVYSQEEMKSLDISGKTDDYDSYHHETAEIDFSNFKTGESGNIVFYFQWEYDEENPYNPSNKISGMSKIVGYYVGEKGVAIGADAEDAQNIYRTISDSSSDEGNEIKFGYYDENYSKPLPSARIAMKCNSFCPVGEQLTVDVAKGDGAFHPQDYDSSRIYEYSIYPSQNFDPINDEKLIINGESGSYKKEYAGEDMQTFDIDGKYTDYDAYNHETAVIDFKNYEVGSSGCITFSFKAIFTDDPANPSTSGMMQNMYFYVGEKGISISNLSVENAIEDYQATYGSDDNKMLFGYYDANYSKPLPSARIAMKCNSFCTLGEQLTVDVAKGDGAFHPQDYDSNRIYEYSIYPSENFNQINDENMIINGEKGNYKKEYAGEEMKVFDIDGKYADYDAYNHETAVIDFKNYEVGSSGCITFSFKAIFTDDPENPSTSGMLQNMYFYVGEKGVAISNLGIENAIEDYQAAYGTNENND